jgi:predicted XRE-type DNA-binding protein
MALVLGMPFHLQWQQGVFYLLPNLVLLPPRSNLMQLVEPETSGVKQGEASRHYLDFYETPAWMTIAALSHIRIEGIVGECCVGGGAISSILNRIDAIDEVWTNDIDPKKDAYYHLDATDSASWEQLPNADWIFTNPPYAKEASPIVQNAYAKARIGIIMLLRQSWDEVCDDRASFLDRHPPTLQISLPRYCFRRGKDGTWTTDSSPVWVFAWDKRIQSRETRKLYLAPEQLPLFHRHPECAPPPGEVDTAIDHLNAGGKFTTCESSTTIYLNKTEIRLDGGTQCRKEIDIKQVDRLVELLEEGVTLDPSEVMFDGEHLWLVDGFHRHLAYEKAGIEDIPVIINRGDSLADAQFAASAANKTNKSQLPRTRADIRNAISLALAVRPEMSDRAIAEHVGCSHPLVSKVRQESTEQSSGGKFTTEIVRVGKDGVKQSRKRSGGSAAARESEEILRNQHQEIMTQREEIDRLRAELSEAERASAWNPAQFKDPEWIPESGGQLTLQTVDDVEGVEPPDPDDYEDYERVHAAWAGKLTSDRERKAITERDEALRLVREQAVAIECLKRDLADLRSQQPSDPFEALDALANRHPDLAEHLRSRKVELDELRDERDVLLMFKQGHDREVMDYNTQLSVLRRELDGWKQKYKAIEAEAKRLRDRLSDRDRVA